VLAAALAAIAGAGIAVEAASPFVDSAPMGPSRRRYANAAAAIATSLGPEDLLVLLQRIEGAFGRRRSGRRWRARVLDLDIVLWSGGPYVSDGLTVPHPAFRERRFVLGPATQVARGWRDPVSGLTISQLKARLTRPTPLA